VVDTQTSERLEDAFRLRAREQYARGSDESIEIDEDAAVSMSDDGAFVAAWVCVARKELEARDA
jgi:hypothetical protein